MVGGLPNCGGKDHPLVFVVKQCLADEPSERPTAKELISRLQQREYSKQPIDVVQKVIKVIQFMLTCIAARAYSSKTIIASVKIELQLDLQLEQKVSELKVMQEV